MSIDDDVVHSHGLDVREDVLQLYASRKITALQAILLAHVDYFCCPFEEEGMVKSKRFTISTLRKILRCSTKTVGRAITDLNNRFHNKLFKARKISKTVWELRTRQRHADRAFYIYPELRELFEEGRFTPTELFVMAIITKFTRNGLYCWLSDRQIGKLLGLEIKGVRRHLEKLRRKNELIVRTMTHDEAREWLQKIGYDKPFHRRGKRITRFLFPEQVKLLGNVEVKLVAVKLPATEPKQKTFCKNNSEEPHQKAVVSWSQFEALKNCLKKKPFLVVDTTDGSVVLVNSDQMLDMVMFRRRRILVLNVLGEMLFFAKIIGADNQMFDLRDIMHLMGVHHNTCYYYVRNGYLVPRIKLATAPEKHCQYLFDWTDALATVIIGHVVQAGIPMKVGCKVQPLLRQQLQLPEQEEAPAQT